MILVIMGTSSSRHSFNTHVGIISRLQVVEEDFIIILVNSCSVTGLKILKKHDSVNQQSHSQGIYDKPAHH